MVNESDIHLLEAYLDDALSASEVLLVDSRLSAEPALTNEFNALRTQRAVRIAAFHAIAPSHDDADRLANALLATVSRRQWERAIGRYARIAAAVAACLLIGFAVGRMEGGGAMAVHSPPAPAISVGAPVQPPSHADTHLVRHTPVLPEPGQYHVAVLDENGNVIAIQRFDKLEDARQFADDLGQYELRRKQVRESQAMLVSDRF